MLPRWLLLPLVVTFVGATEADFVSAMKSLLFGSTQHNATANADLQMHPSPSVSGYPAFHQFAMAQQQASGQSCMMPQQIGTGPYRIPRWYYNPARGRCELFYWSGCCGNGNNFQTFQSCQSSCEVDPCTLDQESGVGSVQLTRFYFNKQNKLCEEFVYFGAGGNRNNFLTVEECQAQCPESPNPCAVSVTIPGGQCTPGVSVCGSGSFCHVGASPQTTTCCPKPAPIDRCQQPLNVGVGNANLQRWYFNPLTQQCQPCVYRGLQGNENNFLSKQECDNSCLVNACKIGSPYRSQGVVVQCSAANPTVCPAGYYCHVGADSSTSVCCQALGGDPCSQPMDSGVGSAQLQRWYWNLQSQSCLPFSYCGRKGTQNNFLSKQDCERTCYVLDNPCALGQPQMTADNRPQTCSASMNTCGAGFWCHFGANQQTTVCCPGRVEGQAVCQQSLALGNGDAALPRWYYDATSLRCVQFFYRGRYGNQNNFMSQEECEQTCPVYVNVCPVGNPLLDSSNRPVPCTFGTNSCGSGYWCHLGLVPDEYQCCPGEPTDPGACQGLPEQRGELGAPAQPATRYYYDQTEMTCKQFIFNGRKGNQNNFLTLEDCEQTCNVFTNPCNQPIPLPPQMCAASGPDTCGASSWCHIGATPDTTLCCPSEGDPCSLPLNRGTGNQFMDRWYYNQQAGSCQPFTYAGLRGNQNNFLTRESCEERCGPNPCFEGRPFAGVDGRPQTCSISANLNTCPASYWCHIGADMSTTVCCPGASTNICNLPMSTGEGNYNLERYYFDQSSKTCRPFVYNGLKGNQNNFITLRACQLSCQPLDNPCIGQPATTAAGQVLFCSSTNKDTCPVNFWCHLGATPETTVCCPGATNACSVPLAPGTGNAGLSRWYYNPDDRQCLPFQYNGKRGNQNNFETQSECERTCPEELCLLSIDRGACGGRQTRYAFNRQTSQCIPFDYTGCGGNLNNFVSMMDCMATCGNVGFRR